MNKLPFAGSTLAGLSVLAVLSSLPTNAHTQRMARFPAQHPHVASGQAFETRKRFDASPSPCTTSSPGAFVGVIGQNDEANGADSAVLGGFDNGACDAYDGVGGGQKNTVGGGGAAIDSFIASGYDNGVNSPYSFIGSGTGNGAFGYGYDAVGSGNQNTIAGSYGFIGSGELNTMTGNESSIGAGYGNMMTGDGSSIGSGEYNTVSSTEDALGGGSSNTIEGSSATIGGGGTNTIATAGSFAAIGGGFGNVVSGQYGSVGGGDSNHVTASFGTVPGGDHNQALGILSFAAGYQAHATHGGSFVWSDYVSGASPLADSGNDEFVVRASGGTYVYSSENLASGVHLEAGSGTWSSLSDRNAKTDVVPLDDASILAKVAALPIDAWQYKTERGVRHVGPMAQDFYAAFGTGEDDRHITSIDEDGVALAAIKALNAKVTRKNGDIELLTSRLKSIERRLRALESHRKA